VLKGKIMDIQTINYLANLSKLNFTPDESEKMSKDMSNIIELMDTVREIDITFDPKKDNKNVYLPDLREDVKYDSFSRDKITANASATNGYFTVPKVVE
jgi:aspartyl-tRNA(Asn)/glutamyl-tRNA(Gln) amidotransferase subunit C